MTKRADAQAQPTGCAAVDPTGWAGTRWARAPHGRLIRLWPTRVRSYGADDVAAVRPYHWARPPPTTHRTRSRHLGAGQVPGSDVRAG